MAAKKKVITDVIEDTIDTVETEMSLEKIAYMEMILNYKKHNPVKYSQKEEAFLKKLNSL